MASPREAESSDQPAQTPVASPAPARHDNDPTETTESAHNSNPEAAITTTEDTSAPVPGMSNADTSSPAQHDTGSEDGEVEDDGDTESKEATNQQSRTDDAPPLPNEPAPGAADDGWEAFQDAASGAWWFYNRFTQERTWENPRVPATGSTPAAPGVDAAPGMPPLPTSAALPDGRAGTASGYNPAIHGSYDPNAWYAKTYEQGEDGEAQGSAAGAAADGDMVYVSGGYFNRRTGKFQTEEQGPERHGDEAKSHRQMNAYFDVDAAANSHDGRSLKAERSGKKPSKSELKAFKEKRRAKKEEKRRAWLRD